MREKHSMTRQSLSQLRVSPLRLQQGLFGSLALMVTLIAGQQMQHWQQSQQPAPQFERPVRMQTHFSSFESRAIGSVAAANVTAPQLRVADQDSTLDELPTQERWVF
jgi:hypothetical protein